MEVVKKYYSSISDLKATLSAKDKKILALDSIERYILLEFGEKSLPRKPETSIFCNINNVESLLLALTDLLDKCNEISDRALDVLCVACKYLLKVMKAEFHVKISVTCTCLAEKALEENNWSVLEKCFKCLKLFGNREWRSVLYHQQRRNDILRIIHSSVSLEKEKKCDQIKRDLSIFKIVFIEVFYNIINTNVFDKDKSFKPEEWFVCLFSFLFDDDRELRKIAYQTFCILKNQFPDVSLKIVYNPSIREELKSCYSKSLVRFARNNEPDWVNTWCLMLDLLGFEFSAKKNNEVINCLLEVEEAAFRSPNMNSRFHGFVGWKYLVNKFLEFSLDDASRRLKLLMQPLISSNSKTMELTIIKFEVWWQLIVGIEPCIHKHPQTIYHFLNFCFGPVCDSSVNNGRANSDISTATLLSSRRSFTGGSTSYPLVTIKRLNGLDIIRTDALAQILNVDSDVNKPEYKLQHFKSHVINNPRMFLNLSKMLIHCVGECTLLIVDSKEITSENQRFYLKEIWKNLILHIKKVNKHPLLSQESSEKTEMIKNLFKLLLKLNDMAVENSHLACVFLNPVLDIILSTENGLSETVLTSRNYYVGTEVLMGTPLLIMLDIFLSSGCLSIEPENSDLKLQSEALYMILLQRIFHLGIGQLETTILFTQAIIKRLDAIVGITPSGRNKVKSIWILTARLLFSNYVGLGRDINQGTEEKPDFSCLISVLMFPITYPHLFLLDQDVVLKNWGQLLYAFQQNVFANVCSVIGNEVCNLLCGKVLKELSRKKSIRIEELFFIISLVTNSFEQIPMHSVGKIILGKGSEYGMLGHLEQCFKLLQILCSEIQKVEERNNMYFNILTQFAKCFQTFCKLKTCPVNYLSLYFIEQIQFLLSINISSNTVPANIFLMTCIDVWRSFLYELLSICLNSMSSQNKQAIVKKILPVFESSLHHCDHNIHALTLNFSVAENIILEKNDKCLECKSLLEKTPRNSTSSELAANTSKVQNSRMLHGIGNRALTQHQKDTLKQRKEDIPALYEDLTQDSQSSLRGNSQDVLPVSNNGTHFFKMPSLNENSSTISSKSSLVCVDDNIFIHSVPCSKQTNLSTSKESNEECNLKSHSVSSNSKAGDKTRTEDAVTTKPDLVIKYKSCEDASSSFHSVSELLSESIISENDCVDNNRNNSPKAVEITCRNPGQNLEREMPIRMRISKLNTRNPEVKNIQTDNSSTLANIKCNKEKKQLEDSSMFVEQNNNKKNTISSQFEETMEISPSAETENDSDKVLLRRLKEKKMNEELDKHALLKSHGDLEACEKKTSSSESESGMCGVKFNAQPSNEIEVRCYPGIRTRSKMTRHSSSLNTEVTSSKTLVEDKALEVSPKASKTIDKHLTDVKLSKTLSAVSKVTIDPQEHVSPISSQSTFSPSKYKCESSPKDSSTEGEKSTNEQIISKNIHSELRDKNVEDVNDKSPVSASIELRFDKALVLHSEVDAISNQNSKNKEVSVADVDCDPKTIEDMVHPSSGKTVNCKENNLSEVSVKSDMMECKGNANLHELNVFDDPGSQEVNQECHQMSKTDDVSESSIDNTDNVLSLYVKGSSNTEKLNIMIKSIIGVNPQLPAAESYGEVIQIESSPPVYSDMTKDNETIRSGKSVDFDTMQIGNNEKNSLRISCDKSEYVRLLSLMPQSSKLNDNPKVNRVSTRSDWARKFGFKLDGNITEKLDEVVNQDENRELDMDKPLAPFPMAKDIGGKDMAKDNGANDSLVGEDFIDNSQDTKIVSPKLCDCFVQLLKFPMLLPGTILDSGEKQYEILEEVSSGSFSLIEKSISDEESHLSENKYERVKKNIPVSKSSVNIQESENNASEMMNETSIPNPYNDSSINYINCIKDVVMSENPCSHSGLCDENALDLSTCTEHNNKRNSNDSEGNNDVVSLANCASEVRRKRKRNELCASYSKRSRMSVQVSDEELNDNSHSDEKGKELAENNMELEIDEETVLVSTPKVLAEVSVVTNDSSVKVKRHSQKLFPKSEESSSHNLLSGRAAHLVGLALTKNTEDKAEEIQNECIEDNTEGLDLDIVFSFNEEGQEEKSSWIRHVPQSEASPGKTNLKRNLPSVEDNKDVIMPLKKNVRFSCPEITKKLHFKKCESMSESKATYRLVRTRKGKILIQKNLSEAERHKRKKSSKSELVWPSLKDSTSPVSEVIEHLTTSVRVLKSALEERSISTIGGLCSLSEDEVEELPMKTPKLPVLKLVLQAYEDKMHSSQTNSSNPDTSKTHSGLISPSDIKNYLSSIGPEAVTELLKNSLSELELKKIVSSVLPSETQSIGVGTEVTVLDEVTSTNTKSASYLDCLYELLNVKVKKKEKSEFYDRKVQMLLANCLPHVFKEIHAAVNDADSEFRIVHCQKYASHNSQNFEVFNFEIFNEGNLVGPEECLKSLKRM